MSKSYWMVALAAAVVAGSVSARAEDRELRQDRATDHIDARETRQAVRIEQGIKNGALTPTEAAGLEAKETSLAGIEAKLEAKGDGKLTVDEAAHLNKALNAASAEIWAEKHNDVGTQDPVYRLGKNVTLNAATAAALANPELTPHEAQLIAHDFGRMLRLKRLLATGDLPPAMQARLQARYNYLLNKYFTVTPPSTPTTGSTTTTTGQ